MQGFLSRDGTPPAELLRAARAEVRRYGVEIVQDRVVDAMAGFALRLATGRTVEARQVLLATGAADELPDVAGARSAGAVISCTARTATAGKCATGRSACSGQALGPSSTRTCSANGPMT
jgi:thioredoxin reductase